MKSAAQFGSSSKKNKRIPCLISEEGKLSFPKMRRRKPSSISISVENGDLILGNVASSSRMIHAGSSCCPTTFTPYTMPCMSSGCVERNAVFASMPVSSRWVCPCYWHASAVSPHCQSLDKNYYPAAELQGSFVAPAGAIELDARSPSRIQPFDSFDDRIPESPPDSMPTSTCSATPELNRHSPTCVRLEEPIYNGRLISTMSFEELLDILPGLSPDEIKVFWQPAMRRRARSSSGDDRRGQGPLRDAGDGLKHTDDELYYSVEKFRRTKSESDIRLNSAKGKATQRQEDRDTLAEKIMCDFIIKYSGSALDNIDNAAISNAGNIITKRQSPRADDASSGSEKGFEQTQAVDMEELQAKMSHLEDLASQQEKDLKTHRDEIKILKQDIKAYEREERRMLLQMREKDAQIALLNSKVAQLLTMSANMFPSSVDLRLDKNLPSPVPSDCGSVRELKPQIDALKSRFSFADSVETLDVVDDVPTYRMMNA